MTEPTDPDLIALATPYALHAVPETELADIERRVSAAPPDVAQAFDDEVRAVRETMAAVSAATAVEPPHQLRDRLLTEVSSDPVRVLRPLNAGRPSCWRPRPRWSSGSVRSGWEWRCGRHPARRPPSRCSPLPDVRTVSGAIPSGGTATVVFSREKNAGVLVMNNVAPPQPGTVYQMWLVDAKGPHSAGTMDAKNVAPSTTAVLPDLGDSQTLAFTVEPPGGWLSPAHQRALRQVAVGLGQSRRR